jgi:hypothetical protein
VKMVGLKMITNFEVLGMKYSRSEYSCLEPLTRRSEPVVNLQGADHLPCVNEQLSGTNVKVITFQLCLYTPTTGNLGRCLKIIYFIIDRLPQSECQSEVTQNAVYDELVSFGIHAFSAVPIRTVVSSSCNGIHSLLLSWV